MKDISCDLGSYQEAIAEAISGGGLCVVMMMYGPLGAGPRYDRAFDRLAAFGLSTLSAKLPVGVQISNRSAGDYGSRWMAT